MPQTEEDPALHQALGRGFQTFDLRHQQTLQCLESQAPYNGGVKRGPLTAHFPSEHLDLLAYATCMVSQKMAQYQLEAFASISGAQTNHTCSHQQWESQELQHSAPAAV